MVPSKYSDAARDEDATIVVLSDPECIYNAVNIDIDGKLGVFFTQSRQDACQVHYIVHFVCFNELTIPVCVTNI